MKIVFDYFRNAVLSAGIGLLVAIVVAVMEGSRAIPLGTVGAYSLLGAICGTVSRVSIESSFYLFGRREWLAYAMNAAVVIIVVLAFNFLVFGGFGKTNPIYVIAVLAFVILASSLLVYSGLSELRKIEEALEQKRRHFEDEDKSLP